ncbi:LOW QUALITY PROTEIN: adenylate cyclase type 10-like [Acropora muricata]|uniref:LOW QUALITY PROTEIN: adenylate cyclase type 10-like n=1 Tax=Acropora muricata TaxID=159855 RepID=UPI0034E38639
MPRVNRVIGVCMFADISGFTSLCETYALKASEESCGTEKLTTTLNKYLGKIVEDILKHGGDVLKFAGDALLALWVSEGSCKDTTLLINKAIICSIAIQEECDNYLTDVGVTLGVKIALSVGKMIVTHVGVDESKHFDLSGRAVDDVNKAEKWAEPGAIILSHMAYLNCDQTLFLFEIMADGWHYRVAGAKVEEKSTASTMHPTGVSLALMSGVLTTDAVLFSAPTVAKRIFAPHLGTLLSRYHPELKLPRLFRKRNQAEQRQSIIPGKAHPLQSERFDDPDHRTDVFTKLSEQDIADLRAYVSKPVLSKIDHGQDLDWLSEMRQVSVLFINMVLPTKGNSNSLALQKAFEVIYECSKRLRGNLNKVFSFDKGCTFVVIFGLPGDKHEDDPARALKAAQRILDSLHQIMDITNESIGVTTGRAFCGVVGHRDRHEYTVIGRKVNMAARLMMNYPRVLSCDDDTYRLAKSKLKKEDFVTLPFVELKGIAEPGIVREYNKHHDREVEEEEFEYPIIGRSDEVNEIKQLLQTIKSNDALGTSNTRFVSIEGEGGIGKTRILEEIMDVAEDEDYKVDFVEADLGHAHTPYYVVQNLVTNLLELDTCRTAPEREHALMQHITDLKLRERMFLLNDLLGTHIPPNPDFAYLDSDEIIAHFHTLLFEIVHQFAVSQPCLFAVDNAQFIDPESWDFLEDLSKDSHAILVLALRPFSSSNPPCETANRLIGHNTTKRIKLGGLPAEVMSDLACQLMDVMYIPSELDEIIRRKSQGVASWCEQLIKDMLTSEIIKIVDSNTAFSDPSDHPESSATSTSIFASQSHKDPLEVSRPLTPFYSEDDRLKAGREDLQRKSFLKPQSLFEGRRVSQGAAENLLSPAGRWSKLDAPISNSFFSFRRVSDLPEQELLEEVQSFQLDPKDFVRASRNSMPFDTNNVCIVTPGVDLAKVVVPDSVKDMVLARVDRMLPLEQLTLKCSSILGAEFHRNLLQAILPKSIQKRLDLVVYNLAKESILECASLAAQHQIAHNHHGFYDFNDPTHSQQHPHQPHHHHHHNVASSIHASVYCGCHADEVTKVLNLSRLMTPNGPKKHCLYLKFVNTYVQETLYSLWLEDQRKEIHEKAAMFLESQAHKCKSCGGGGFVISIDLSQQVSHNKDVKRVTGMTGRTRAEVSEMRQKVQSQGAFSARAHERSEVRSKIRTSQTGDKESQEQTSDRRRADRKLPETSEAIKNAVIEQAEGGKKSSCLCRFFCGKSVNPTKEESSETQNQLLLKISHKDKSAVNGKESAKPLSSDPIQEDGDEDLVCLLGFGNTARPSIDLSSCNCAEVLASVFPQLVDHWRAAGNKLKTMRYLTESGAAALATSANMRALSYLYEVQSIIEETKANQEPLATREETARVESLIGQALSQMNRLHEALAHLLTALQILGKKQPTSDLGCYIRIRKEALRHCLHVFLPGYYIGGAGENSALLIEQSRCLSHLSYLYHSLHQNNRSLMAALEELNSAEEAEENLHELINAYAGVIECAHLVGWNGWGKTYEEIGKNRCQDSSLYLDAVDMLTVAHLYCVSLAFRLAIGGVTTAISSGEHALAIAKQVQDSHLKTTCIPLLAQGFLMAAKISSCLEVLKELNSSAQESNDLHGQALYMCCCFDVILEAGWKLEDISNIMQFTITMSSDPAFSADILPKFYLNASLALWYARKRDWENAESFFSTASALEPPTLEVYMSVHGFVKMIEFWLLKFQENGKNKQQQQEIQRGLKKLQGSLHQYPVFKGRQLHLLAYYLLLKGKKEKCKAKLRKCYSKSKDMGLWLEIEWAKKNMNFWFSTVKATERVYHGQTMFTLPKPRDM